MRPIKPRGGAPAADAMPRQPMPLTNVLPSRPPVAPAIGGGGPANPAPMPMPRPTSMPMTNVKPAAPGMGMKKGGKVKSSASKRADGIAQRGKTKGKFV